METKNLDIYGSEPIPWERVFRQLEEVPPSTTFWLATTDGHGNAHVAGVGAKWDGGKFYFVSGAGTRKSRNLTSNPNCAVAFALPDVDVTVEGRAAKVTDPATLERLAARFAAGGWPAEARNGSITAPYSAPSAGPGPWDLYEMTPIAATGVATAEPHGASGWTFPS